MRRLLGLLLFTPLLDASAFAQGGELMENVVETLTRRYYDEEERQTFPRMAGPYLERARETTTLRGERKVTHAFLEKLGISHLGLLSTAAYKGMIAELSREESAMFGFQLVQVPGGYYVDWLYEGGPAQEAGLLRGDQVVAIDGIEPGESERLDWRTDDSALPDPALHGIMGERGDRIEVRYRRTRGGEIHTTTIEAKMYSGWEATKSSVREVDVRGYRVGVVHYWFIPMSGGNRYMRSLCQGEFADCDALVFDLRGRGGAAHEAMALVNSLDVDGVWGKPLVLLVHDDSRSAKEVISSELQKRGAAIVVGEQTHGAVIPATFEDVGFDTYLMFPAFTLGDYTKRLEGIGVTPDIPIDFPLEFTAGADPIERAGLLAAAAWCDEVTE